MRQFEIGDGLKSIKVSNNFFAESENEETIVLYDPEIDFAEIRISVITVETNDSSDIQSMFRTVQEDALEEGIEVNVIDDKSFYNFFEVNKEDDLKIFYFKIGYFNNIIIISVTTSLVYSEKNNGNVENLLKVIESFIPTIKQIELHEQNIFEPIYSDYVDINERIANVLNIDEEEIEEYHESDKTITLIQKMVDDNVFDINDTYQLQSLGIALGDYLQFKNNDFHWAIVRDEYGRDLSLQFKTLELTIFPMTLISKRIEEGEDVNVIELVNNLLGKIDELSNSGELSELDYND